MRTGELMKTGYLKPGAEGVDEPLHHIAGKRQFGIVSPKKGKVAGNWGEEFTTVNRLYEGEPYEPAGRALAKMKIEERKRWRTPNGFVPSNPGHRMTGPGTYDGTFGKYEHMDDGLHGKAPPKQTEVGVRGPAVLAALRMH